MVGRGAGRGKSGSTRPGVGAGPETRFTLRTPRADMSATISTPGPDEACDYCGSRIFDHDPLCVRDCTDDCGSPSYFCNYACLSAHIGANDLAVGDACRWSPDDPDCC